MRAFLEFVVQSRKRVFESEIGSGIVGDLSAKPAYFFAWHALIQLRAWRLHLYLRFKLLPFHRISKRLIAILIPIVASQNFASQFVLERSY